MNHPELHYRPTQNIYAFVCGFCHYIRHVCCVGTTHSIRHAGDVMMCLRVNYVILEVT